MIICQRIGVADPLELYQANIGSHNIVLDLHFYNLFDPFFVNISVVDNIQYIYKSREGQLQALNNSDGPLVLVGKIDIKNHCLFLLCIIIWMFHSYKPQTFLIFVCK